MTKKILTALAVLSFSIASAQATTLSFGDMNGISIHGAGTLADQPNDIDFFKFENLSAGNVDIYIDTLSDGFDAEMNVWTKVNTPVSGQFENSEWALVRWSPAADRPAVETGLNVYDVALKNDYELGNNLKPGISDPGATINLAAGEYLVTVAGVSGDWVTGGVPSTLMSKAFLSTFEQNSQYNTFPHNFKLIVEGNNVAHVSSVPVPAAVWLFGTALFGLGVTRRTKTAAGS